MKGYMGDQAKRGVPHTQRQPTGECADSWNGGDFCKRVHRLMWVGKCVRCPVGDEGM